MWNMLNRVGKLILQILDFYINFPTLFSTFHIFHEVFIVLPLLRDEDGGVCISLIVKRLFFQIWSILPSRYTLKGAPKKIISSYLTKDLHTFQTTIRKKKFKKKKYSKNLVGFFLLKCRWMRTCSDQSPQTESMQGPGVQLRWGAKPLIHNKKY